MNIGSSKSKKQKPKPVEFHDTAAWADKEHSKQTSQVNIPGQSQIMNAKQYVDDNQK